MIVSIKSELLGTSVLGKNIQSITIGDNGPHYLYIGVFHGDEPQGKPLLDNLTDYLASGSFELNNIRVTIIPVLNPDGLASGTRHNANGVDLNRNFPTQNWEKTSPYSEYYGGQYASSEPETRILTDLLNNNTYQSIVTVHAPLHIINYDGPSKELAHTMSHYNGYKVESSIGYPTPGSFGTYAGIERNIPTITLELPENVSDIDLWQTNKEALLTVLQCNLA